MAGSLFADVLNSMAGERRHQMAIAASELADHTNLGVPGVEGRLWSRPPRWAVQASMGVIDSREVMAPAATKKGEGEERGGKGRDANGGLGGSRGQAGCSEGGGGERRERVRP